jgi:phage/plasmid-associated DNA primase
MSNNDTAEQARQNVLNVMNSKIERELIILKTARNTYTEWFNPKYTSGIADQMGRLFRFKSIVSSGEDINKATLFSYHEIYENDGRTRVSTELEKIRKAMESTYQGLLKKYGKALLGGINEKNKDHITKLLEPLKIEIRQILRVEVINSLIARNPTKESMNPASHIPFKNGLLNLVTRKLEPFTPDLFFTYQINANFLNEYVTLQDVPMFRDYLNQVYYEPDIPMILSYFSYSFYPGLPVHKVLFVLGRERVGKGTGARILRGLIPSGYGSVQLDKLLISDRFMFTGIIGKNVLVDAEIKRKFKRGVIKDFKHFNELFGGDSVQYEMKGHEGMDYISQAKGIFIGNLPFFDVDNPAAINRILLIETRNEKPKRIIPELDRKILDNEGDKIATLLMEILFKLKERDFTFPGEMTSESTTEELNKLADPVENFIDEMTEFQEGAEIKVDEAYSLFTDWCNSKGIPTLAAQSFKKKFGNTYPKKIKGSRNDRHYAFMNCIIYNTVLEVETHRQSEVDHEVSIQRTPKNRVSYDRYRRDQHVSYTPRMRREEENNNICVIEHAHKLITGEVVFKNSENKAHEDSKGVINLNQKSKWQVLEEIPNLQTYLEISDAQKEKTSFTTVDGVKKDLYAMEFDSTYEPSSGSDSVNDCMILVSIIKDFNVAWFDKDWFFHDQDLVHVPGELAAMLIKRGIAREIRINTQSQSNILQGGTGALTGKEMCE